MSIYFIHLNCWIVFYSIYLLSYWWILTLFPIFTIQTGLHPGSEGLNILNFTRNCQITLQNGCANLYSHQQHMRVPLPPHPHQLSVFQILIFAYITGMKWYPIVVELSFSWLLVKVSNFFRHLLTTWLSSSVNCLPLSFAYILLNCFSSPLWFVSLYAYSGC